MARRIHAVSVVLSVAALVLFAGCGQSYREIRGNAATAALASYPGEAQESDRFHVAAVDDPGRQCLELVNFGDHAVPTPLVWVNRAYVNKAPTIPSRGTVVVRYAELIRRGTGVEDLTQTHPPVTSIELQTDAGLWSVRGPARR